MIYSIGVEGEPPRMFIDTDVPANALLQCQPGETCVQIESVPLIEPADPNQVIRDALLNQISAAELSPEQEQEYEAYREALYAIDFNNVVWPVPPQTFPRAPNR